MSKSISWELYLKIRQAIDFLRSLERGKPLNLGFSGRKECIYVNLLKINTDNLNNSLLVDKNTEPVLYGKYSIFCIQDAVFWHAVLINEEFYCFDIRELANKMNLSSSLQNEVTTIIGNKRGWLQNFFQKLEESTFFFDIENC